MKILILLFIICNTSNADERSRAIDTAQQAILAYPEVQAFQKTITTRLEKNIPLPKEYAGSIASITLTLMKGKIDTKSIKSNYTVIGGQLRPDAFYDLKTDEIKGVISINWDY